MQLSGYLRRIGFTGHVRPDIATLRGLHRAHQLAVPFENLDVQLRRPLALDPQAQYDKLVTRSRGGWCFEMNGVFGWALREIGFDVTRLCAGSRREQLGDAQLGNHLALKVQLEEPWLVDVGYGGTLLEPLPLRVGGRTDEPYVVALTQPAEGWWRFSESTGGERYSFDFRDEPADEALLARRCRELQRDPGSSFLQNLVAQRRTPDTHVVLRGRVLSVTRGAGTTKQVLGSAEALLRALRERFDLDVPEVASLWPAICARHDELFPG